MHRNGIKYHTSNMYIIQAYGYICMHSHKNHTKNTCIIYMHKQVNS